MLVLSRKKHEEVVIALGPQRVVVSVVELRGDKVRLGFEADPAVVIHRAEVARAIEREAAL